MTDSHHQPMDLGADHPLSLWQGGGPWRVCSGFVDLFAVRLDRGAAVGRRSFLLRVGNGGLFFALPAAHLGEDEVGIIAVGGLDTSIRVNGSASTTEIDDWLVRLAAAVQDQPVLRCDRVAVSGRESLRDGEVLVGAAQRPLWCRLIDGSVAINNDESIHYENNFPPILLTVSLWLTARGPAQVELLRSQDLAEALVPALAHWHGRAALLAAHLIERRRRQQADMVERRAALSQAMLQDGLTKLAAAVSPQGAEGVVSAVGDPLLTVLRKVGDGLGISLRVPSAEDGVGHGGSRLDTILAVSSIRSRVVLLRGIWWRQQNGPLVGWMRETRQPVALLPAAGGYLCWRPDDTPPCKVDAVVAAELAGDALMLYPRLPDRTVRLADFLALGLRDSLGDIKHFLAIALGAAMLALLVPIATGLLVDEVVPAAARDQLLMMIGGLVAAALCTGAFELVKGLTLLRIEGRLDAALQAAFFDRLLRLSATFFKTYSAGDLSDRVLGIQAIRQMLAGSTVAALIGGVFSSVSLILLFVYNAKLALLAVGLTMVSLAVTVVMTMLQLRHERAFALDRGKVEGLVLQLVTGVAKLKVAAAQDRAIGAWAGHYAGQKRRFVAAQSLAAGQAVFQALFPPLATVAIFLMAAWLLKNGASEAALKALTAEQPAEAGAALGAGAFLAFQAAFGQFLGGMTHMVQSLTASLGVLPLYERARPILDAVPENHGERPSAGILEGAIEFAGVGFSYHPDSPPVVQDLSFSINPGEFVALVGPSGSGKSTVMRLLLGLEQPSQGDILFDGKPVGRLNLDSLRAQVAVVLQSGRILPGSVLSNIVGQNEAALADAWEAARLVGLEDDIRALPMGMHTVVMEGGGTLSGGQRQRLMIARALVKKPRVLLLDEATSALDNRTQAIVTESLVGLNITRLVIAHRLSTIEAVDRVLVLENGRLVQQGGFAQLRDNPGLFADLARRQTL